MANSIDLEFEEALLVCRPKGRPPTHRGDKSQQGDGGQLPFRALALQQALSRVLYVQAPRPEPPQPPRGATICAPCYR